MSHTLGTFCPSKTAGRMFWKAVVGPLPAAEFSRTSSHQSSSTCVSASTQKIWQAQSSVSHSQTVSRRALFFPTFFGWVRHRGTSPNFRWLFCYLHGGSTVFTLSSDQRINGAEDRWTIASLHWSKRKIGPWSLLSGSTGTLTPDS